MKKHFILSAFAILFALGKTLAQTYIPIATTGYSLDGVAENTTAIATTGGALDNSDFVLYSQYYGTLYSGGVGLPNNGLIASGTRTYQLQSYTGFNVMHILASYKDSLNFVTPQPYPSISLLAWGTQGAATASITVRFTDNTTQVFSPINMDDWFTANPSVYNGFDRATRTSGAPALVGPAGNPRMFGIDLAILCANQGKSIMRVIVQNNSASAQICVMAVAGNIPSYAITANPPLVCSGGTTALSATGLTTYTWLPVGSFAGSNSPTVSVSPTSSTTYTLLGDNGGCPAYTTGTVTVSSGLPVLSLTGSTQSVCLGAAATITAGGALVYTLTSPAANGGTFVPTASAIYTVTGANGCGANSQTVGITVSPLLITASTPTALVCAGSPATLIAGGAASYTWAPGASSQTNYIVAPTANTTYTVIGKTGSCFGTNTISISTTPLPTLNITPSNSVICDGDFVNLTVSGNALTYTWSPGNSTSTSISDNPSQITLYGVSGTNSQNCVNSAQQLIFVNPNPTVTASASNPTVCSGSSCTLTASGASTYSWGPTTVSVSMVVNPIATTVYTVAGSYTTGCTSSGSVTVNVFSPTISISSNTAICLGASATLSAGVAFSFSWSNGLPGLKFVTASPTLTTVYTLTGSVNNQNGLYCPATNSVQVTVNPNPTISITSAHSSTICNGESILLTGAGAGSTGTYTWSTGVSTVSIKVNPTSTKTYTVSGTDNNGCIGTGQFVVKVITCAGIEKYTNNSTDISIYPNPSSGEVNIRSEADADLILINELGQPVRSLKLNNANGYHVTVEGLSSGVYYVTSINNDNTFRQKIVITK